MSKKINSFRNFILANYGLEVPRGNIPGSWFAENGLPMIVRCTCCDMTMAAPFCWVDEDGYTYCGGCVGEEE